MTSRDPDDDVIVAFGSRREGEHVLVGLVGHGSSDAIPELESGVRSTSPQPPPPPVNVTEYNVSR